MAMTTEEKRSELIRKAKGETTQYDIEFFIDAGGVITILGGMESTHSKPHHIIHGGFGDNYLSLLRGKNGEDLGQDLINRQREQEKKLTQEEIQYIEETFNKFVPADSALTLKKKVNKLSGGQQRLLSIISDICIRNSSNVFLIDEPLNNLDIENVINISDALNRIVKEKPDAVFLMVSHCKIFPFITNIASIEDGSIIIKDEQLICNSCFGIPDENGYYSI